MPQGLARMIRRWGCRPFRRRLFACLVLALATLVAPLESGLLPDLLGHPSGQSQAQAQSPFVVDGTAAACDEGWTADRDLCRIEGPACPSSPYNDFRSDDGSADRLMQPSTDFVETSYPEFCEERVRLADEPAAYSRCAGDPGDPTMPGFAVLLQGSGSGAECWALQLRTCEFGFQVSLDWCQAEVRRSWTCEDDAIPRNEFNTCYVVQPIAPTGQVCALGAPELKLVSCEDYVGTDFTDSVICTAYGTGFGWEMSAVASNPYWCSYNASFLSVACHDATPQCGASAAVCLKRASETGGCDGIAQAILCRNQQWDFRVQAEPVLIAPDPEASDLLAIARAADNLRRRGCEPCQALPFEPTPLHCPEDRTAEPAYNTLRRNQISSLHRDLLDQQGSPVEVPCANPPSGDATWLSTHASRFAVVNAPVMVQVRGVPLDFRPIPHGSFDVLGEAMDWGLITRSFAIVPGVSGTPSTNLMRTYGLLHPDDSYSDAASLANQSLQCVVEGLPALELIVEELWPDKDYTAIRELFGPSSVAWWDGLSDVHGNPDHAQRRRQTQARGLTYWPDLTDPDDQEARDDSLETRVSCNAEQAQVPWCRWIPTRSGYYRLKVGGAWLVHAREDRAWSQAGALRALRRSVMGLDGSERARTLDTLAALGCGEGNTPSPDCAWQPSVLGLNDTLTDILPTGPNDVLTADVNNYRPERDPNHLYWLGGDQHRFGGMDLRVGFRESREFALGGIYTETESFGVQVGEVQVSTVTPSD